MQQCQVIASAATYKRFLCYLPFSFNSFLVSLSLKANNQHPLASVDDGISGSHFPRRLHFGARHQKVIIEKFSFFIGKLNDDYINSYLMQLNVGFTHTYYNMIIINRENRVIIYQPVQ